MGPTPSLSNFTSCDQLFDQHHIFERVEVSVFKHHVFPILFLGWGLTVSLETSAPNGHLFHLPVKNVKFTLEQATKTKRGSKGIALLFL